ncbi:hypothetical protein DXA02_09810 [Ruminococcus sp. AM54-1NS]|nr:hypothetical protein DXA02_09810 [Ruminococcus sp. AM54-1NS]RGH63355.1 hypothetical protein DW793_14275 [Ruminococcus sp. AM31-15AC]
MYEQQSTYNPNMPVRALIYAGMLFSAYIENNGLSYIQEKDLNCLRQNVFVSTMEQIISKKEKFSNYLTALKKSRI